MTDPVLINRCLSERILTRKMLCITLISSCGCNLQCEYCLLNRSKGPGAEELQLKTIQALQDGTYLQNVKNALIKLEIPFSVVTNVELWGQEPTLTLHLLTEHLEDWVCTFPNWRYMMFSTNAMQYPERIVDYIKKLDQLTNNRIKFDLQFSYDGTESTNELRGANDQVIFNNISYIIKELNQYRLQHIDLNFFLHGVLSVDLLRRLNTIDKIRDYYNVMGKFTDDLYQQIINPDIKLKRAPDIALETPVQASTEEGLLLGSFVKNSLAIPYDQFYNHYTSLIRKSLFLNITGILDIMEPFGITSVENFVNKVTSTKGLFDKMIEDFSGIPFCGTNSASLHILYDGTITTCQSMIFDSDINSLKGQNDFEYQVKKSLIEKKFFCNPLKESLAECKKFLYRFEALKFSSYQFLLDQIINLMFWMSKTSQISGIYLYDPKLLLRHALLICIFNCCIYNNRIKTGSMFVRWDGLVRFLCNGFIEEAEAEIDFILQHRDKGEDLENDSDICR